MVVKRKLQKIARVRVLWRIAWIISRARQRQYFAGGCNIHVLFTTNIVLVCYCYTTYSIVPPSTILIAITRNPVYFSALIFFCHSCYKKCNTVYRKTTFWVI